MAGKVKKTNEQFIEELKSAYGNSLGYELVNYIHNKTKVIVTCKKCNKQFNRTPNNLLKSGKCPHCAVEINKLKSLDKRKKTFIKKSIDKYGNKFNYELVYYIDSSVKVEIYCNRCNTSFLRLPGDHLVYGKCLNCERTNIRRTTEMLIEQFKLVHKDLYDYKDVVFENMIVKIDIFCNRCLKIFKQSPERHLGGQGCRKCNNQEHIKNRTRTLEQFLVLAKEIWNDKFDYSLVNYINDHTKINIFCKEGNHYFLQSPKSHLKGQGCQECENKSRCKPFEQFKKEAEILHPNKYIFYDNKYINSYSKIDILCKSCNNIFKATPRSILNKRGCPVCASKKVVSISKKEIRWLDSINIPTENRNIYIKEVSSYHNRINVDGFDPINKICYFFHGDYWHGNPRKFDPNDINKRSKKTFGELYSKTIEKENILKATGYTVISIWELDWDLQNGKKRKIRENVEENSRTSNQTR